MLKKISVEDLRPGMFVHELCGSWWEHALWRRRFACRTPAEVAKVRESGVRQIWIDTGRGLDVVPDGGHLVVTADQARRQIDARLDRAAVAPRTVAEPRVAIAEELAAAKSLLTRSRSGMSRLFAEVRSGSAIDMDLAEEVTAKVTASVVRHPGALISLARLRSADDYTYLHSIAVSASMAALARQLGMDAEHIRKAGLAGLLLDIGKARVAPQILNKRGALTEAEFAAVRAHAVEGHALLGEIGITDPDVLDVCLHHHEKYDGTGYPHGLKGEEIGRMARMAAVCDTFDALTAPRPHRESLGMGPADAVRSMADWAQEQFDESVFQAFVKTVGVYPIGSIVRLACGRVGVVVDSNPDAILRPKVKVFYSLNAKMRIIPEVVDLGERGAQNRIVGRMDPAALGLRRIDEVWAAEALAALRGRSAA